MRRLIFLFISHGVALAAGFALGVYLLPILTAPPSPDAQVLEQSASEAMFTATLTRELRGSDFVHWGEGTISVSADKIVHIGKLAPGPDYKLYLVKEFAQHEDEFEPIKDQAVQIGDVKTFEGFVLDVPAEVDVTQYSTVLVWCEAFGEFITAGQYQ